VVFVGTFTAGELEVRVAGGGCASREGTARKFVREVEHRTFSGPRRASAAACSTSPSAACSSWCRRGRGLELIEIAPGIDLQRDILDSPRSKPRWPNGGAARPQGDVVVNYDHFSIRPELMDDYTAMVQRLHRAGTSRSRAMRQRAS
jgi:hypothetical protein